MYQKYSLAWISHATDAFISTNPFFYSAIHNILTSVRPPTTPKKQRGRQMTKKIDPEQLVALEELLVSNTVQLDTITQLLVEKGVFTKDEFFDMLKQIQKEFKKKNND